MPSQWAKRYRDDLQKLGLMNAEYAVPSPWAVRAGESPPGVATADEWLTQIRYALRVAGLERGAAATVTLHTAKRTLLTWAGTSGCFKEAELAILGHHRSAGVTKLVRAYNTSELSVPVQKLAQLLDNIAGGKFLPDAAPGLQWNAPPASVDERPALERSAMRASPPAAKPQPRPPQGPGPDPYGYITATDGNGERRRYTHVAQLMPAGGGKAHKVVVESVHGPVTNLCDFRIHSAVWGESMEFADARLCKGCMARARR